MWVVNDSEFFEQISDDVSCRRVAFDVQDFDGVARKVERRQGSERK